MSSTKNLVALGAAAGAGWSPALPPGPRPGRWKTPLRTLALAGPDELPALLGAPAQWIRAGAAACAGAAAGSPGCPSPAPS